MKAVTDLTEALKYVPIHSHREILTILAPHFSPEMLAASVGYLEQYESRPMKSDEIVELVFTVVEELTEIKDIRHTRTRKLNYVFARQLAMFAIYTEITEFSCQKTGALFNPKYDHATTIHAINSMTARYSSDKSSREIINSLANIMEAHQLTAFKSRLSTIKLLA